MPALPRIAASAALVLALVATGAAHALPPDDLEPGRSARVAAVVDGDTVTLDGGSEVRLVGIQAPKLPLGRPGFRKWPLADEAKAAAEELTLDRIATLHFGGRRVDRHGRWLAHLYVGDVWVQGELLRRGLARVYSFADNRARVAEMLAIESAARAAGRGIWALDYYRVLRPEEAAGLTGTFQIVEGRVFDVAHARPGVFLDFGADWRNDFAVAIATRDLATFVEAGLDPERLVGATVRVRGWIDRGRGPVIKASHPEQLEVIGP